MCGEGFGTHASTTIPASVSLAVGDDIGELRIQRRFAESKPRRFQEDDELYAEKFQKQQEFAGKMVTSVTTCPDDTTTCPAGATVCFTSANYCLVVVTTGTSTTQHTASCSYVLSGSPRSRPSPDVPLGSVENDRAKIVPGRIWREDQKAKEEVMIQDLEKNSTSIYIDSGAGESVCPMEFFPDYETHHTEKVGNLCRAAGEQDLRNVGDERPQFKTNGTQTAMTFQATTHVKKPLAAASKITEKGNHIVLDDENSLNYIENTTTCTRIQLRIENGVYAMKVAGTPNKTPFRRPEN